MTTLALEGVADDALGPLSLEFRAGIHVVLCATRTELVRLTDFITGVRRPRSGRVLVDGKSIVRRTHRALLATLLVHEELVLTRSVRSSVAAVLALRRVAADADVVLERAGLSELGARRPDHLDDSERHAVALALALEDTQAGALVLYDPLGVSPLLARDYVVAACSERARSIAVVVVTAQLEDAVTLGGTTWLLQRGKLAATGALAAPRSDLELVVRSPEARRLAALLADEPAIHAAAFDERHGVPELLAKGGDLEAVALAVVRSAARHQIAIESLSPTLPALQTLLADTSLEPPRAPPGSKAAWAPSAVERP